MQFRRWARGGEGGGGWWVGWHGAGGGERCLTEGAGNWAWSVVKRLDPPPPSQATPDFFSVAILCSDPSCPSCSQKPQIHCCAVSTRLQFSWERDFLPLIFLYPRLHSPSRSSFFAFWWAFPVSVGKNAASLRRVVTKAVTRGRRCGAWTRLGRAGALGIQPPPAGAATAFEFQHSLVLTLQSLSVQTDSAAWVGAKAGASAEMELLIWGDRIQSNHPILSWNLGFARQIVQLKSN